MSQWFWNTGKQERMYQKRIKQNRPGPKKENGKEATQSTSDKPLLYQSTWHQKKAQKQHAERIHTWFTNNNYTWDLSALRTRVAEGAITDGPSCYRWPHHATKLDGPSRHWCEQTWNIKLFKLESGQPKAQTCPSGISFTSVDPPCSCPYSFTSLRSPILSCARIFVPVVHNLHTHADIIYNHI
jgi:hypothetical protein